MTTKNSADNSVPWAVRLILCASWAFILFLRACGRIKVYGVENIKRTRQANRLVVSNHPSFLETFLIPLVGWMPEMVLKPSLYFPWQIPNAETVERGGFAFLKHVPIIPLRTDPEGRPNDGLAMRKILKQLQRSTFIIFPEGTRSFRADEPRVMTPSGVLIGQPRQGVGFLIAYTRPIVVPVLVIGADYVNPPSAFLWTWKVFLNIWFHQIKIIFGEPFDYSRFFPEGEKPDRETHTAIGKALMEAVAKLDPQDKQGKNS